MKRPKTKCWIVKFDDFTRAALIEIDGDEESTKIRVKDRKKIVELPARQTTIENIQLIHENGLKAAKHLSFQVVLQTPDEEFRFAQDSEWNRSQIHHKPARKLVRGRIGRIAS